MGGSGSSHEILDMSEFSSAVDGFYGVQVGTDFDYDGGQVGVVGLGFGAGKIAVHHMIDGIIIGQSFYHVCIFISYWVFKGRVRVSDHWWVCRCKVEKLSTYNDST